MKTHELLWSPKDSNQRKIMGFASMTQFSNFGTMVLLGGLQRVSEN